jgi:hypothetical protein
MQTRSFKEYVSYISKEKIKYSVTGAIDISTTKRDLLFLATGSCCNYTLDTLLFGKLGTKLFTHIPCEICLLKRNSKDF